MGFDSDFYQFVSESMSLELRMNSLYNLGLCEEMPVNSHNIQWILFICVTKNV